MYFNSESGDCYARKNNQTNACDFKKAGLTNIAKNKIDNVKWYLGGSSTYNDVTAEMFYQRERGTDVYNGETRDTSWVGKVALIYPSDFGYATSGSDKVSRKDCLANTVYSWSRTDLLDCSNNDWVYGLTITPSSKSSYEIFEVSYGDVNVNSAADTFPTCVIPTIYLKPDVKITSGVGTIENPFILK